MWETTSPSIFAYMFLIIWLNVIKNILKSKPVTFHPSQWELGQSFAYDLSTATQMMNFKPFFLFIFLPAVFNFLHWNRKSLLKVRANIGHHRWRNGVTNAISPAYVLHFMQQGSSPYVWWIIKGMQMGSSNNRFHERFRRGRDQEKSQVKTTNILYIITVHSVYSFMETKRVCLFSLLKNTIFLFWLKCLTMSHLREWKQKGFFGWTNSQCLYVYSLNSRDGKCMQSNNHIFLFIVVYLKKRYIAATLTPTHSVIHTFEYRCCSN